MLLCFQKSNVFVGCGSADVADPCEFRHMGLLALVSGVVPEKSRRKVIHVEENLK